MSASSKKKLRKEQNAAMLTERQQQEQKEAKKLKRNTILFVILIGAVLCAAIITMAGSSISRSGIFEKATVAGTIGDKKLNSVEMSYYYMDAINAQYSSWNEQYGDYTSMYMQMMGLDLTKSLADQVYDNESGQTWADHFVDVALENAQADYALYDAAKKAGFTLSEEEQESLENIEANMSTMAYIYGFSNVNSYLRANYGNGASIKTYSDYAERSMIASGYRTQYVDALNYDDAAIREFEADKMANYNSYSYAQYLVSYTDFREGGTKDEEGNVTYSEEENNAARDAAKAGAESLQTATTVEELDAAIAALTGSESKKSTVYTDTLYTSVNSVCRDWIADESRQAGDITVIPNETTTQNEDGTETTVVNGYYVVRFESSTDNAQPMSNVRHILFSFEGGTKDDNGNTTYSDEEKAAAKEEAEALLATWQAGEATDASFEALVHDNTDDEGSKETGGLYENINPNSSYVENFLNWAIDDTRKAGDTGIVETEYGYHLMYYVGDTEMTYRDYMISEELRAEEAEAWFTGLTDALPAALGNTSKLNKDIVLSNEEA